jgi:hypothetical protein
VFAAVLFVEGWLFQVTAFSVQLLVIRSARRVRPVAADDA